MSGEGKWKTVGRKDPKKGKSSTGDESVKGRSIGGLRESNTVFARYGALENRPEGRPPPSAAAPQPAPSTDRGRRKVKKVRSEKHKQQSTKPFQQRAKELEYETLNSFLEDSKSQFIGNLPGFLREVAHYMRDFFADVDEEKDYTFSDKEPSYPSSELDSSCRDLLLSQLSLCPQLALEGVFRNCIDSMLADIKGHVSSYGTRILLQLLVLTSPHLTTGSTERIVLLLESNLNRVPEALSLLWVGLPHPQPHPLISLEAWGKICQPLYVLPNVPRQVVNYVISYSGLLLSIVGDGEVDQLCHLVPPSSLCELVTSSVLVQRRTQKDVQDFCELLQAKLLASGLAPQYFSEALPYLGHSPSPELLIDFMVSCLSTDGRCFSVWQQLHPSYPNHSAFLLSHLHTNWKKLTQRLPGQPLRNHLLWMCQAGNEEEKEAAKTLLGTLNLGPAPTTRAKGGGCLRCFCCSTMAILALAYLCVLGAFLVSVAFEGPQKHFDLIHSITPSELSLYHLVEWVWSILSQLTKATQVLVHTT